MTQAFNLSQLANRVNTSGQLNVATGASGTLPIANGGTGLSTVGTNGQILQSNGSALVYVTPSSGGVTSLNGQTGAITNTDLYAIGSYINGRPKNNTGYAVNSTLTGSSLWATATGVVWSSGNNNWQTEGGFISASLGASSATNVGTWRCLSPASFVGNAQSGIWVRIS